MNKRDLFYGVALITFGFGILAFQPANALDAYLQDGTNAALTVALLLIGALAIMIAVKADPVFKALAVAWLVLP